MERKFFITIVMVMMACGSTWSQDPLYDSTRVYDIVTDDDTFYLYPTFKPCFTPGRYDWAPIPVIVQEYVSTDTVTVYGVAVTFENRPGFGSVDENIADYNTGYRALLMKRLGPSPVNSHAYSMELVDSVSLGRSHPRFCWFRYEDDCSNKNMTTSCYEFYFDTPKQYGPMNRMIDTFYVGRYREILGAANFMPIEYGGEYSATIPSTLYQSSVGYEGAGLDLFFHCEGNQDRKWGVAFPIIGFRCGPMLYYWMDAITGDSAVVHWPSAEQGTLYNVRLTGSDGSDTTVVTAETSHTFTHLSDSVIYNVTLRKQCHYCTSNYDTTVYGRWTPQITFGNGITPGGGTGGSGSDTTLTITASDAAARYVSVQPNPAMDEARVLSSLGLRGIEAYNAGGQKVYEGKAEGLEAVIDVKGWPRGTYLLRIQTPMGTVTKKLLVE